MPDIRPSSELRNNYGGIMQDCRKKQEPIFLTVNGKGDGVIMAIEDYRAIQNQLNLIKLINEAEEDVKNGKLYDINTVFDEIREKINKR